MYPSYTGALLHDDHAATILLLQDLEAYLDRAKGVPAFDEAARTLMDRLATSLRREVEGHFGFEENHLFPVFTACGETGIVTMLTQEHRAILPLALEVAEAAKGALDSGAFAAATWETIKTAGTELIEREMFHIQKEEMGLLTAIAMLVDPATDQQLAKTYREVMAPLTR